MADLSTGGGGGGDAYTYVQDPTPSGAEEGESWYDTGANAAYVYDGASWIEQTVVDHSELSGVGSSDHHAKPTGTGSASPDKGGYQRLLSISGGSADESGKSKTGFWISDYIKWSYKNNSGNTYDAKIEVTMADGSTKSRSYSLSPDEGGTDYISMGSGWPVVKVYTYSGSYTKSNLDLRLQGGFSHSHNI